MAPEIQVPGFRDLQQVPVHKDGEQLGISNDTEEDPPFHDVAAVLSELNVKPS